MLDVTTTAWLATVGLIAALFAIDLIASGRQAQVVGFREAVGWSVFYIAVALGFGVVFGLIAGWEFGGQYFAGYIVEKSLSVDNLFVFVVIMSTFAVPAEHQRKVLYDRHPRRARPAGDLHRAGRRAAGGVLVHVPDLRPQADRHRGAALPAQRAGPVRGRQRTGGLARRLLPLTERYDEGRLVTRENGRRVLTPLFLVLVAIGSTDILFALDSIPAVFGVTEEAYIVFAANAFALLGLRALYFLVTGLLDRLVYLSTGLSLILAFIGVKLVLHWGHLQDDAVPEISTGASLVVIMVVLAVTTVASLVKARRDPDARAHPGSLRDHRDEGRREGAPRSP